MDLTASITSVRFSEVHPHDPRTSRQLFCSLLDQVDYICPPNPPIAAMPSLSRAMETLVENLRRLLKHKLMRDLIGFNARRYILTKTDLLARRFTEIGEKPEFIMAKIRRIILEALNSVENGLEPLTFEDEYTSAVYSALRLLFKGHFCGRTCPEQGGRCAICLEKTGGEWWWLYECGHSFHVKCIAPCLELDSRCPLCRADI